MFVMITAMPRARRWTDEQLIEAVAASKTLSEVCKRIGILPGKYDVLRRHIVRLGLDASHLPRGGEGSPRTKRRYTDEQLGDAVRDSATVHDVLRALGYNPSGGMFRAVTAHIRVLGLDTSHFVGQRWSKGRRFPGRYVMPLEEILVENSTYGSIGKLRRRLVAAGLKTARCEHCGLDSWRGEPLPLALDHINGIHNDNRLENLRILCPNCHALTDTWCGRNNGRRAPTGRGTRLRTDSVRVRIPPPAQL